MALYYNIVIVVVIIARTIERRGLDGRRSTARGHKTKRLDDKNVQKENNNKNRALLRRRFSV